MDLCVSIHPPDTKIIFFCWKTVSIQCTSSILKINVRLGSNPAIGPANPTTRIPFDYIQSFTNFDVFFRIEFMLKTHRSGMFHTPYANILHYKMLKYRYISSKTIVSELSISANVSIVHRRAREAGLKSYRASNKTSFYKTSHKKRNGIFEL